MKFNYDVTLRNFVCSSVNVLLCRIQPLDTFPTCKEYQSLSCCDLTTVKKIDKVVKELMRGECPSCNQLVQEWKCAECHPEAGKYCCHI